MRHFVSITALSRAALQKIRQCLPRRKAEAVVAVFSVSMIAESEHARSEVFDNPESVYRACADMKLLNQEVLRIVLLDAKRRLISMVDITKGTLNESLVHPREIFRAVISSNSAYAFVLAHNHPSGDPAPSECDIRLTRRLAEGATIQINMLDHLIIGRPCILQVVDPFHVVRICWIDQYADYQQEVARADLLACEGVAARVIVDLRLIHILIDTLHYHEPLAPIRPLD